MLKVSFVGYCRLRFKFQTGVSRVSIARRVSNLRRGRLNFETWVQIAFIIFCHVVVWQHILYFFRCGIHDTELGTDASIVYPGYQVVCAHGVRFGFENRSPKDPYYLPYATVTEKSNADVEKNETIRRGVPGRASFQPILQQHTLLVPGHVCTDFGVYRQIQRGKNALLALYSRRWIFPLARKPKRKK